MEDKWVIAWRDDKVLFARSWSGETVAMADAVVEGGELRISQLYVSQNSFPGLGEPTIVVDWMIRSHALEERLPLPVDNETAELLHNAPLLAMNAFGHRLFCAGLEYKMPPPTKKLYSLGALQQRCTQTTTQRFESWPMRRVHGEPPSQATDLLR